MSQTVLQKFIKGQLRLQKRWRVGAGSEQTAQSAENQKFKYKERTRLNWFIQHYLVVYFGTKGKN